MKNIHFITTFCAVAAVICLSAWQNSTPPQYKADGKAEKSLAAFNSMLKVLKHPRCLNCHPSDDRPRQGDDAHVHLFNVQRGADNQGMAVMRCNMCHQSENNAYSGVPGAPNWHLAPKSMAWQGLTDAQIGQALLDKSKNKGRDVAALVEHLTKDSLVQWAWNPGEGRQLPPLSQTEFAQVVKEWADNGAIVPK